MKLKLLHYWDVVTTSFWFLPALITLAAAILSFATVALDAMVTEKWIDQNGWVFTGGPEAASATLAAIAGSMITIAGVVFSMTLVALSLASSQFGPRLLRNFMRDTANQVVLGIFIATFLYCLLVLRTIRWSDANEFVPHVSVTLGVAFAVVSLGVLIYFIHHVAVSIQADALAAAVGADLLRSIERLFPDERQPDAKDAPLETKHSSERVVEDDSGPILAARDGYVQRVDLDALLEMAAKQGVVVRVERRPGHYVVVGAPLAHAAPAGRVDDDFARKLAGVFIVGSQRVPAQDVEYAANQLVEVAVRALSPGVNDPFTAITCVDRIGSALSVLARRAMPSPRHYDAEGVLRVIFPAVTFVDVLDCSLNQIRQYARDSAAVNIRMLEMIAVVAQFARRPEDIAALRLHADMIARGADLPEEEDRKTLYQRHQLAKDRLQQIGK